ncbi:hypothetical protein EXW96_26395 [Paenibacillus sp. JMULE4]|uniref:hypothetical protein n=1 Tax=Paenibacillus sp. JMULE4 TaxID=2518342 RepID=UPI0015758ED3|nr:hypothetical protein [Paenibacillus sp. JMULE4]NTZ20920.1 hypothetical protein [Paenibacillus sp. JMULE4]
MRLESLEIRIADHAYERYCQRVEKISRELLIGQVIEQLQIGYRRKQGYIKIGDVWWRSNIKGGILMLHTCYGRHHIDLPAAIRWAKQHRDRINLGVDRHTTM